jgi:hypothetical protein
MALINGQMIGDMKGKLGGMVLARNKAGKIARQYVIPTDAKSGQQVSNRSGFGQAASQWATLTDLQRQQWNNFAATNFSGKRGAISGSYSGYQSFVALNANLAAATRMLVTPTMSSPSAVLTVVNPPTYNVTAPLVSCNSTMQTSAGALLQQTLIAGSYVSLTGELTFTIGLGTSQSSAPVWQNYGGTTAFSYIVNYSNIIRSGAVSVSNLLAYTVACSKKITVASAWSSSASFTINMTVPAEYLSGLKRNFQTGSKFYMSVFCMTDAGQSSIVGSVPVTAT